MQTKNISAALNLLETEKQLHDKICLVKKVKRLVFFDNQYVGAVTKNELLK